MKGQAVPENLSASATTSLGSGDRLVWLRIDAAGVKEFVVYIRMGGEGEIVVQMISKCTPGQFEETISRARPAGWENVDQLYGMALHWVTA